MENNKHKRNKKYIPTIISRANFPDFFPKSPKNPSSIFPGIQQMWTRVFSVQSKREQYQYLRDAETIPSEDFPWCLFGPNSSIKTEIREKFPPKPRKIRNGGFDRTMGPHPDEDYFHGFVNVSEQFKIIRMKSLGRYDKEKVSFVK